MTKMATDVTTKKITGKRRWRKALITGLGCVLTQAAPASPAPLQVKTGKMSPALAAGVLVGGEAREEFSVLGVKQERMTGAAERLTILYGDRSGAPLHSQPGYFHIAMDRASKRVVIDLAQVSRTAVDQKDLAKILSKSALVASSDMTMDPQDGSTNITLNLRSSSTIAVSQESAGQGKIILELREIPKARVSAQP